jgi:hypothetical protein
VSRSHCLSCFCRGSGDTTLSAPQRHHGSPCLVCQTPRPHFAVKVGVSRTQEPFAKPIGLSPPRKRTSAFPAIFLNYRGTAGLPATTSIFTARRLLRRAFTSGSPRSLLERGSCCYSPTYQESPLRTTHPLPCRRLARAPAVVPICLRYHIGHVAAAGPPSRGSPRSRGPLSQPFRRRYAVEHYACAVCACAVRARTPRRHPDTATHAVSASAFTSVRCR